MPGKTNKYIAFIRQSEPAIVQVDSFITNLTAQEIQTKLKLNDEILGITTPLYREVIPEDCVIENKFPDILLSERPARYLRPSYYVSILPKDSENIFTIFVNVKIPEGIEIPPVEMSFNKSEFKTCSDFNKYIISNFPFQHSNPTLTINNEPLKMDEPPTDLFSILKKTPLTFNCTLDPKELNTIHKRVNVLTEIQTTEEKYIDGLQVIIKYWVPNVRDLKVFTDAELHLVFHDFPTMIRYHQQFLENLKARGTTYSAMLSDVFLDFAAFFKVSLGYISNYSTIIKLILEKSKQKDFSIKMLELATNNPYGKGELQSYLITPVQRMPRYILFLTELLKVTPVSHPDSAMLSAATLKLEEVTFQIDQASYAAQNSEKLLTIQNRLISHFEVVKPSRVLVMTIPIEIRKPTVKNGFIYLFNDMILITKEYKNGLKVVHSENPSTFRYATKNSEQEWNIMVPRKRNKFVLYTFSIVNPDLRKELIAKLNEMKETYCKKEPNKIFKFSLISGLKDVPNLFGHCSVYINNSIFVFCGQQNSEKGNDKILEFNEDFTELISQRQSPIPLRTCVSLSLCDNFVYIFGGRKGNDLYNNLYGFDIYTNEIKEITANNPPKPVYGHTSNFYNENSKLYIFGGMISRKRSTNEMYTFDTNTFQWEQIKNPSGNVPPSLAHHSATIVGKHIFVHGGIVGKHPSSGTYIYDITKNEWSCPKLTGDKPLPRAMHRAVLVGQFIVIIGGTDSQQIMPPAVLDTKQMKYSLWTGEFDDSNALTLFSMCYVNKKLWIYGGRDIYTNKASNCIYTTTLPNVISEGIRRNRKRYNVKELQGLKAQANMLTALTAGSKSFSGNLDTLTEEEETSDATKSSSAAATPSRSISLVNNLNKTKNEQQIEKTDKEKTNEDVKIDIKEDVKAETKEDVKTETKEDVKTETKEDVKKEVKENVKTETKEDVNKENVKTEVKGEAKKEIKTGVFRGVAQIQEVKNEVRKQLGPAQQVPANQIKDTMKGFDEDAFCKELKINRSLLIQFQQRVLTRKLSMLWSKRVINSQLRQEVETLYNEIKESTDGSSKCFSAYVKLLYRNKAYVTKIDSNVSVEQLKEIIEKRINCNVNKMFWGSGSDQNEITDQSVLFAAFRQVEKSALPHLQISVQ
ncbi:Kelch motif family protein [Histomonas meleagridis]|uniref:Kelch motif family protein n=1 Tax=Histomonas meleagridis TaxID=135588 RepID=UPI00355AC510|nr:Kelch motif family protein [Histomonas meleagridis]KAH0800378.1 Kelch motif family protein [Histomonas meleagridis]